MKDLSIGLLVCYAGHLVINKERYFKMCPCFKVEGIDLKYSEDAHERIREECCPGKPFVVYRTEVTFTNVCCCKLGRCCESSVHFSVISVQRNILRDYRF